MVSHYVSAIVISPHTVLDLGVPAQLPTGLFLYNLQRHFCHVLFDEHTLFVVHVNSSVL